MKKFPPYLAVLLLAASLAMILPPHARAETVNIGTFEASDPGWSFRSEPGAKGSLNVDNAEAHSGHASLRLNGDFRADGGFVSARRTLLSPATVLHLWLKARGVHALEIWLSDFSGQTFEHQLALKSTSDWQQITLEDFANTKTFHGGPGDGKWYRPLKEISLRMEKSDLDPGAAEGVVWIDDISVEDDPPGPPIAMEKVTLSGDSIFGFSDHMIHTDFFYGRDKMGPYFRQEYTLPWVVNGRFGLMREPLYQGFFAGEKRDEKTKAANRALVEKYLDNYGKAGVRVLLCPMFTRAGKEGFDEFFQWLGTLPAKYPAVIGYEMHNEPHLKFFGGWKGPEYAEAVKRAAGILQEQAPHTPIVIGSMSHLWWGPAVQFLKSVLQNGALEVASGISVHPYRKDQAPEGGAGHSAKDDPQGLEKEMRDFWSLIEHHNPTGKPLELHLTEFGYSSGTGQSSLAPGQSTGIGNEERQADYLTRMMLVLFDLRLRGIPLQGLYWYNLKSDRKASPDLEGNFGLIDYEASQPKPGYTAYATLATTFQHTHDWWSLDKPATFSTNADVIKSFTWQRLSDGALVVPFWRLNQLQKEDADFETELSLKLPSGFQVARVTLRDLHEKQSREVKFSESDGILRVRLKASARAAWIEIEPRSPASLKVAAPWQHALPAAFNSGPARIQIEGPHQIERGKDATVEIIIDNRESKEPFVGLLQLRNQQLALNAKPGKKTTLSARLATVAGPDLLLEAYYLQADGTVFGRGDFTVALLDPDGTKKP
ncbi:hypothetical protein BH09VER1_BH09VER1_14570 [soil metagenome]